MRLWPRCISQAVIHALVVNQKKQGDREDRPIRINLSRGAGWGSTRVPARCEQDELDAGDLKGLPNPPPPALAPPVVDGLVFRLLLIGRPQGRPWSLTVPTDREPG